MLPRNVPVVTVASPVWCSLLLLSLLVACKPVTAAPDAKRTSNPKVSATKTRAKARGSSQTAPRAAPATVQGDAPKPPSAAEAQRRYRWSRRRPGYESLARRIAPPPGYRRVAVAPGSYGSWLRHLPMLPKGSPVLSYQGQTILPAGHRSYLAVVDLDVGKRDRQQCMDTIMRLRGEYLHHRGRADRVAFAWAGGRRFGYRHWRQGQRPQKEGRRWRFVKKRGPWSGYKSFRRYLGFMFSWTGTIHQRGERKVRPEALRAGDFFIQAGSPGHAVVVLDVATGPKGERVALLGQGFMPAQDLHILAGTRAGWFPLEPPKKVLTPLWSRPFAWSDLRRFRN